eukprot:tig00000670_g3014.t1
MDPQAPTLRFALPPANAAHSESLPVWQGFLFSSVAPMGAAVFTNPFDVARVRMQLQGERSAAERVYKNSGDVLVKVARAEGIRGLEKGLITALFREGSKNLFRLGLYDPIMDVLHKREEGPAPMYKRFLAGALSGAAGAVSCNPFEIVKTRMQAQGGTGHQHNYTGIWSAFGSIVQKEGLKGLYRGSGASVLRSSLATGINLPVYGILKERIAAQKVVKDGPVVDALASLFASFFVALAINPVDVVRTRLFNQPLGADGRGALYAGGVDCARKLLASEGPLAFWKGFFSSFMRLGPHFVLTFVFLEQMKRSAHVFLVERQRVRRLRHVFDHFDLDGNGLLDRKELHKAHEAALPPAAIPADPEARALHAQRIKETVEGLLGRANSRYDGALDLQGFMAVSHDINTLLRRQQQADVFAALDMDGSGTLSFGELVAGLRLLAPLHLQKMSRPEYEATLEREVLAWMKRAGRERSGLLTFEQFVEVVDSSQADSMSSAIAHWISYHDIS